MNAALESEYDNLLRCIRCAACLSSCPTYVLSHKEEEGPRGRIAIMRAIVEGHLQVTPDAVEHLQSCLLCEACSRACPSGVEMERLGVAFRAQTLPASAGHRSPSLLERFVYGWLFGELLHVRMTATAVRFYQRSGLRWLARHLGVLRVLGLRDKEALLPEIPDRFVVPEGQPSGGGEAVQLFVGCVMSTAFAGVSERTAGLARAFGCEVTLPPGQMCCGALQLHAGRIDRARELAAANLEAFDGQAPIVVNSAGCGAMLKHYGQLLPIEPRATAFAARVRDVSEFLAARQPLQSPREVRRTVAVQDACHLLHAQRIGDAPRSLLSAIPGVELRLLDEPGLCCGSAGFYNVTHSNEAAALQARKCDRIEESGADTVVTGNPGCLLQIRAGLRSDIAVMHVVDVLAEAYL